MEETIFEAAVDAARIWIEPVGDLSAEHGREIVKAVIQAIIDRTPSPTTVVELTRILREGGVDVPEATFD